MTYDEFVRTIVQSDVEEWIYDDEYGRYIFKNDLTISILAKEMDYTEDGRFYEEWATQFIDKQARKKEFILCYNGNEIENFFTASVDGGRMYIPYPSLDTMSITKKQYVIGKIVNIPNQAYGYDDYLSRIEISVE